MTSPRKQTIAVYGGSFNPPHRAHEMVAEHITQNPHVDALWIVPTFQHAFDKPLIDFTHRLRMCELAFAHLERTRVLDVEREIGGRSLMARTLETLAQRNPDVQLRLVLGSDLIDQLERWTEPETIRRLAPPLWVQREGTEQAHLDGPVFPDLSSTEVRTRLRQGDNAEHWLADSVAAYIKAHQLYR